MRQVVAAWATNATRESVITISILQDSLKSINSPPEDCATVSQFPVDSSPGSTLHCLILFGYNRLPPGDSSRMDRSQFMREVRVLIVSAVLIQGKRPLGGTQSRQLTAFGDLKDSSVSIETSPQKCALTSRASARGRRIKLHSRLPSWLRPPSPGETSFIASAALPPGHDSPMVPSGAS